MKLEVMSGCCSSPAVMAAVAQVWSLCVFLCGVSHSFPQWSQSPQYPHAAAALQHRLPPQSFSQRVAPHQWHGRFPQTLLAPQSSSQRFAQAAPQSSSQRFAQTLLVPQSSSQRFAQAAPALQDKCAVPGDQQVSCGPPAISGADCAAIHCCFDGQRCFYGNAVTVQCVRDGQFVVVVATDLTDPPLSLDALHLLGNDSRCGPVASTPYFGIFQFPVTACGTTVSEDSGFVVYENRLISSYEVGIGALGSITRDSHFELVVQCRYSDSAVEALVLEVDTVPPPPPVAALGPMRVELRLASGQCVTKGCAAGAEVYSSYYNDTDYPLTKVLREPVYVEVHILARTDPSIVLMLDHCWATSAPSPLGLPRWDLLVNGCPYQGDHYLTLLVPVDGSSALQFPSHYKRFIVKMFTFVDSASLAPLKETIFIHCSTSVCHPSPGDSCSQSCARKRRAVQTDAAPSGHTLVSSGAVTFLL